MAGVTRFFEELLRADEPAAFAAVPSLTTSHWLALLVVVIGVGLLFFFKQRGMLYTPPSGSGEPAHVPQ
jgi:prolipoprotein diacylglyceryltransferase